MKKSLKKLRIEEEFIPYRVDWEAARSKHRKRLRLLYIHTGLQMAYLTATLLLHIRWPYHAVVCWGTLAMFLGLLWWTPRHQSVSLVLLDDLFRLWEIITSGKGQQGVVFRKKPEAWGACQIEVYPIRLSKNRLVNKWRLFWVKVLLWLGRI